MIIQLTKIKLILLIVTLLATFANYAKTTYYSFDYITKNSLFIGSVKITNRSIVTGKNNYLCGYKYDFEVVNSEKDNSIKHEFWSMSDDFNKNDEYQIFLSSSHLIIDNRINDVKILKSDSLSNDILESFQNCKKLIPRLGISADGNGRFKIRTRNDNKYINYNSMKFIQTDIIKECIIKPEHTYNTVKLSCIKKFIKKTLLKKQVRLKRIYDEIIKKSN